MGLSNNGDNDLHVLKIRLKKVELMDRQTDRQSNTDWHTVTDRLQGDKLRRIKMEREG